MTGRPPAPPPAGQVCKQGKRTTSARNPVKTRARILTVAVAEFSVKGFSGARTEAIARRAKTNIRMLYHYFGSKDALYMCVLEHVLSCLRREELQLDFNDVPPLEGLLQMFEFIDGHFRARPELRKLLAFENLNSARHLKRSSGIREMASPVILLIDQLLRRGEADGVLRSGLDALHLYVTMVSLAYYGRAHAHTLSYIFGTDLAAPDWQRAQWEQNRIMLTALLATGRETASPSTSLSP